VASTPRFHACCAKLIPAPMASFPKTRSHSSLDRQKLSPETCNASSTLAAFCKESKEKTYARPRLQNRKIGIQGLVAGDSSRYLASFGRIHGRFIPTPRCEPRDPILHPNGIVNCNRSMHGCNRSQRDYSICWPPDFWFGPSILASPKRARGIRPLPALAMRSSIARLEIPAIIQEN